MRVRRGWGLGLGLVGRRGSDESKGKLHRIELN
jgi:hypothetical protein